MSVRFLPAALIAVIVAMVAVGGAALAFGIGSADSEKTDDLLERAASDLGVDAQALKDALSQAQTEITRERQQEILADLVEAEVITQQQADEATAWLDQMPDAVDGLMRPELLVRLASRGISEIVIDGHGSFRSHSIAPIFGDEVTEKMAEILGIDAETLEDALQDARTDQAKDSRMEAVNDLIDQLVEDGEITQAEGDEIKSWLDAMPEWLMDHGVLMRLMSHGFNGGFDHHLFEALPLEKREHSFGPRFGRIIPELDGLRRNGAPFFFAPDDAFEFEIPRGRDGGPERRFFFRGPEGEFNLGDEIPPELEEFLEGFDGFEDFNFSDLDGLFERLRPLESFGPFAPFDAPLAPQAPEENPKSEAQASA